MTGVTECPRRSTTLRPEEGVGRAMVKMKDAVWTGGEWRLRFQVREGVYHEEAYPVTLTCLGPIDGADAAADHLHALLAEVVEGLVRRQIRLGSLPPRGMLSNWREIMDRSFGADRLGPIWSLMEILDGSLGLMIGTSRHGYYRARTRRPDAPRTDAAKSGLEACAAAKAAPVCTARSVDAGGKAS